MKHEPVQDYILKNERNLRIAGAVSEAWPQARERLVSDFLDQLDSRLKNRLKGWKSEREQTFYEDSWACYCLWKPAWENLYGLGLMWDNYGKEMVIGVYHDTDNSRQRPFCGELLKAVAKIYPSAKKNPWWEARVRMNYPAADWSRPEVLWQMYKDPKFLERVAEQLLALATKCTLIIDPLARKYSKRR